MLHTKQSANYLKILFSMLEHKITTLLIGRSEDELRIISARLENLHELTVVGRAVNEDDAFALINTYVPQLIFIDTELKESCGLEFVERLHQKNIYPDLVFFAPDEDLAYDTLKMQPLDYLVKPIQEGEIYQMIDRLKLKLKREELLRKMDIYARSQDVSVKRVFPQKKGIVVLYLNEIVFCKANRAKTILTLINNEKIHLKINMAETMEVINNQMFFKISRSFCINRNYLRKIDKKYSKCLLHYEGLSWEIPASRNIIKHLESLYTKPVY